MEWILLLLAAVILIGVPRLVDRASERTRFLLSVVGAVLFAALAYGFYDADKKYPLVVIAVVMAGSIATRFKAYRDWKSNTG